MKAMAALAGVGLALLAGCSTLGVGKDNEPAMITDANVNRIQNREWALKSLQLDGRQIVMDVIRDFDLRREDGDGRQNAERADADTPLPESSAGSPDSLDEEASSGTAAQAGARPKRFAFFGARS